MVYGYIRVSSKEQNEDRQVIALREFGVDEHCIVIEKASGKDFDRPNYKRLIKRLKRGDRLVIKSIDRLGRNYEEIINQWRHITKDIGADIIVLDMRILDTTQYKDLLGTFISDLVLQLLSFVAENERSNIRQRQAEGIAAAKARGVHFGRERKYDPAEYFDIYEKFKRKEIRQKEMIRQIGCCNSTYYRMLKEFRRMYAEKHEGE